MKVLRLEDWTAEKMGYKVIGMTNTVEWQIGEFLTRDSVKSILGRFGVNTVKVEIKPKS